MITNAMYVLSLWLDNLVSLIWSHLIVICLITKHILFFICVNAFECPFESWASFEFALFSPN